MPPPDSFANRLLRFRLRKSNASLPCGSSLNDDLLFPLQLQSLFSAQNSQSGKVGCSATDKEKKKKLLRLMLAVNAAPPQRILLKENIFRKRKQKANRRLTSRKARRSICGGGGKNVPAKSSAAAVFSLFRFFSTVGKEMKSKRVDFEGEAKRKV